MAESASEQLDLSACDREPIHIPGAIQPHGVLLAVDEAMQVRRVAGDLRRFLRYDGDPLGAPLGELIETGGLDLSAPDQQAQYVGTLETASGALDAFVPLAAVNG